MINPKSNKEELLKIFNEVKSMTLKEFEEFLFALEKRIVNRTIREVLEILAKSFKDLVEDGSDLSRAKALTNLRYQNMIMGLTYE